MHTDCQLDNLRVLYLDDDLVVIHKPAGILVHRSPIDKTEIHFALQMTRDLIQQKVYPVHRLDKATSGLLLFALSSDAAKKVGQQFSEHQTTKEYIALTRGWVKDSGIINKALKYKAENRHDRPENLQDAETCFKCLEHLSLDKALNQFSSQRYSLVHLTPKTGRKHQIRRHLNHIGHPIIGDVNHGDRHHNHLFYDWLQQHRLYLAATSLSFQHPASGKKITINCPLEPSFANALNQLSCQTHLSLTAFEDFKFQV